MDAKPTTFSQIHLDVENLRRKCSGQAKAKERPTWRWEDQGLLASEEVLLQPDLVKLLPYALHLLPDPTHL
jgi:hypothetical protein